MRGPDEHEAMFGRSAGLDPRVTAAERGLTARATAAGLEPDEGRTLIAAALDDDARARAEVAELLATAQARRVVDEAEIATWEAQLADRMARIGGAS